MIIRQVSRLGLRHRLQRRVLDVDANSMHVEVPKVKNELKSN